MYNVLVFGMTDNPGGMESVIINYVRSSDVRIFHFDFLTNYQKIAYQSEIQDRGGKIFSLPQRHKNFIKFRLALREFMKTNITKYDIFWVNLCDLGNIDYIVHAKAFGAKRIIVHCHNSGNDENLLRTFVHKINRKRILDYVTDCWSCSDDASEWFFGRSIAELPNYLMLPNSINPDKYRFNENSRKEVRKELGIDERELVLGNVGRLVPQKNQKFLIDLLPSLLKKLPNLSLALVGGGRLRQEFEQRTLNLGVRSHVHFLGVRTDVEKLYSTFDVFVFPSLFEGLPEALIEAQANGLICLASTNVPKAAKVTDKCRYLELVPETWIDSILELKPEYSRESGYRQILESSYNLKKSKTMFSDALLRGTEQAELLPDNDN